MSCQARIESSHHSKIGIHHATIVIRILTATVIRILTTTVIRILTTAVIKILTTAVIRILSGCPKKMI